MCIIGFVLSYLFNLIDFTSYTKFNPVCWFSTECDKTANNIRPYIVVLCLAITMWILSYVLPV